MERTKKKPVALIVHKLTSGGAQKILADLSRLLESYYEIHFIVFDANSQTYKTGGELHDLALKESNSLTHRIISFVKRVHAVQKIKTEHRIQCSISFLDGPNLVNLLSKKSDKVIVSVRSFLSLTPMSTFRRIYTKFVCNFSDTTVAISELVGKDLIDSFGIKDNKVNVIYNPCDVESVIAASKEKDNLPFTKDPDGFYFVTVGRFTEAKGHWHLLRAFKCMVEKHNNCHLVFVGKGELEKETKELSHKLNLDNNVIYAGYRNNPHSIVDICDVFVFSSIFEGFGNVLVDALALSKPVISTDCLAGPRDILAPQTNNRKQTESIDFCEYGILVKPGDKTNLGTQMPLTVDEHYLLLAMEELYCNAALREKYRKKALERAMCFSPEYATKEWIELIEKQTN